jgi:hypothetical protein
MLATQVKEQNTIELAQEVYSLLAVDLYRKQKMATMIFDSCHDGVLGGRDNENIPKKSFFKSDPRDVIKKSFKEMSNPEHRKLVFDLVNKVLIIS